MAEKWADLIGPSPYTGEQPETSEFNHPITIKDWNPTETYSLLYADGEVSVSHDDIADQATQRSLRDDHPGPLIMGSIHVDRGKAQFDIDTNLHAAGAIGILKMICREHGWQFGGASDANGALLEDGHISSLYFHNNGSFTMAHRTSSLSQVDGAIHVHDKNAHVYPFRKAYFEALSEWAEDEGFTLYSGDNVIKVIEDLEQHNLSDPNWNNPDDHYLKGDTGWNTGEDEPQVCKDCGQHFPSMNALIEHRRNEEEMPWQEVEPQRNGLPQTNMDAVPPTRFNETQKYYGAYVKPAGPLPFVYDQKEDKISLGSPGMTQDTMGAHFTPGGMVTGVYEPNGKLVFNSMTDYSLSVRHFLDLWVWSNPNLEIKSVYLQDEGGKEEQLA